MIPRIFLNPKEENEIKQGFPWVFDNEIESVKFEAKNGSGVKSLPLNDAALDSELADGSVVELRCTVDMDSRSGSEGANRKVKGTLHWVSAAAGVPCEFRLYEPILAEDEPESNAVTVDEDELVLQMLENAGGKESETRSLRRKKYYAGVS